MSKKFYERFSFKISSILIIIIFFSLLLNSFLNYFNFEKTYKDIVCSRFIVTGRDLKNTIEYQLNLGLYLHELKNIQGLINEIKKSDSSISSVKIFNENGIILFDTDVKKTGTLIEKDILLEAKKNKITKGKNSDDARPANMIHGGQGIIILPVINNFNIRTGSIALVYPREIVTRPVNRILFYLIIVFTFLFLIFSGITMVTINFISMNLSLGFIMMKKSLENLITNKPDSYTPPGNNERMEEVFTEFRKISQKALNDIDALNSEADSSK